MSRKPGKLSTEEEEFIVKNVSTMSIPEIAKAINRNEQPVKRFIEKRKLIAEKTIDEIEDDNRLLSVLHSKPYWKTTAESFSADEIKFFEGNWMMMLRQFNEEITAGEEIHLTNWLTTQILQNRCLKAQKNALEEIDRIKERLNTEREKPLEERNIADVASMEAQIPVLEASLTQYINTHNKFLSEIKYISNLLKATREEKRNVKLNEDTWWGHVASLENEKIRKQESKLAEMLKIATKKAEKKLGQLFVYSDNTVDRPLLNADTVMLDEEQ